VAYILSICGDTGDISILLKKINLIASNNFYSISIFFYISFLFILNEDKAMLKLRIM
jgi:hypothetical protein